MRQQRVGIKLVSSNWSCNLLNKQKMPMEEINCVENLMTCCDAQTLIENPRMRRPFVVVDIIYVNASDNVNV